METENQRENSASVTTRIIEDDALTQLKLLDDGSVQCVVTSPPYWGLRAYGGQPDMIGLEPSFSEHLDNLLGLFREVWRVLRDDGSLWLNYGDSYAGGSRGGGGGSPIQDANPGSTFEQQPRQTPPHVKKKDLILMPARVAMALQEDGWYIRSEIIWHKPNAMPESVKDRPTTAHEKVFLLTKSTKYFYNYDAVKTPIKPESIARNAYRNLENMDGKVSLRNVWSIARSTYRGAHSATFPTKLAENCINAGTKPGDTVLDPFAGSGTVALVAHRLQRNSISIEINSDYIEIARKRILDDCGIFTVITDG